MICRPGTDVKFTMELGDDNETTRQIYVSATVGIGAYDATHEDPGDSGECEINSVTDVVTGEDITTAMHDDSDLLDKIVDEASPH